MKVAIDAYHAARLHGGIARYVRGLSLAMFSHSKDHQNNDQKYVLFSNRFREHVDEWNPCLKQVSTVSLNAPKRLMQMMWDNLSWPPIETWTGSIDIYHGMHFVLPATRSAKCVLTVHDLTYLKHPDFFVDSQLNKRGYLKELPAALKRADAVVAVSESTKQDLITLMGYPEDKIHVVYEGVEPHFFVRVGKQKEKDILSQYGLNTPYMIFLVGTPEPRKNLKRTIRAAQSVAPDMPLALVGNLDLMRGLLGKDMKGIYLLGSVPDDDLPVLLHAAEVSLYPSLYEGFGLPILESMAAGVPVVTSNISSCPEVAGDVAMLVNPYDEQAIAGAIRDVLHDKTKASAMRKEGEARAAMFTWQRAAQDVLQLYEHLVQ